MIRFINNFRLKKKLKLKFPTLEIRGLCSIDFIDNLKMGEFCFINSGANFNCQGGISIGKNVIFGQEVMIQSSSHDYKGNYIPYGDKMILQEVIIEDHVWIGSRVTILPGVTIGEGSIIGAGSIVTKNTDKYSINVGSPAKVVNYRDKSKFKKLKKNKLFYQEYIFNRRNR